MEPPSLGWGEILVENNREKRISEADQAFVEVNETTVERWDQSSHCLTSVPADRSVFVGVGNSVILDLTVSLRGAGTGGRRRGVTAGKEAQARPISRMS